MFECIQAYAVDETDGYSRTLFTEGRETGVVVGGSNMVEGAHGETYTFKNSKSLFMLTATDFSTRHGENGAGAMLAGEVLEYVTANATGRTTYNTSSQTAAVSDDISTSNAWGYDYESATEDNSWETEYIKNDLGEIVSSLISFSVTFQSGFTALATYHVEVNGSETEDVTNSTSTFSSSTTGIAGSAYGPPFYVFQTTTDTTVELDGRITQPSTTSTTVITGTYIPSGTRFTPTTILITSEVSTMSVTTSSLEVEATIITDILFFDTDNIWAYQTVIIPEDNIFSQDWLFVFYPDEISGYLWSTFLSSDLFYSTDDEVIFTPNTSIIVSEYIKMGTDLLGTSDSSFPTFTNSYQTVSFDNNHVSDATVLTARTSTTTFYSPGSLPMDTDSHSFSYLSLEHNTTQTAFISTITNTFTAGTTTTASADVFDSTTILAVYSWVNESNAISSLLTTETTIKVVGSTTQAVQNFSIINTYTFFTETDTVSFIGALVERIKVDGGETVTQIIYPPLWHLEPKVGTISAFASTYRTGFQVQPYIATNNIIYQGLGANIPIPYDLDLFWEAVIGKNANYTVGVPYQGVYGGGWGQNGTGNSITEDDNGTYKIKWNSDSNFGAVISVTHNFGGTKETFTNEIFGIGGNVEPEISLPATSLTFNNYMLGGKYASGKETMFIRGKWHVYDSDGDAGTRDFSLGVTSEVESDKLIAYRSLNDQYSVVTDTVGGRNFAVLSVIAHIYNQGVIIMG